MTMTALFSILGGLGSFIAGIVALITIVKKKRDSESDEIISVSLVFKISLVVITFVVSYKLLQDFTPTLTSLTSSYCTHILETPDGKYKAIKVGGGNNVHYQVMKVDDNSVVFKTKAEYNTPNDVKSATFSSDSKEFAAAYHYGHEGGYTWIGIWNVKTGNLVRNIKRKGWITELCFVFNDPKK